jgi:hypothetical protein
MFVAQILSGTTADFPRHACQSNRCSMTTQLLTSQIGTSGALRRIRLYEVG